MTNTKSFFLTLLLIGPLVAYFAVIEPAQRAKTTAARHAARQAVESNSPGSMPGTPPAADKPVVPADVDHNTTTVVIRTDAAARAIPQGFIGFSYEKTAMAAPIFDPANTALIALFKGLGPGVVRIAGATVEACQWEAQGPGGEAKKIAPQDITRLAQFLHACDWKVIYGINFAANTPEHAADEALAAATLLKDRLLGYEIGNEPNLYNRDHRPKTYGYKEFLAEWRPFADAVTKAVPGAVITGPSTSTYGRKAMALPMARDAKDQLAMLTSHYYITGGKDNPEATIAKMLTFPDKHLEEILDTMRQAAKDNNLRLGFRLDEVNSYHSAGKKDVSDTFASALWAAETLFTCAERGADGINFHVAGYSPYTPILHDWKKTGIQEIRPEFYGLRFFALAAKGAPLRADVNRSTPLRVHATRADDGTIRIALINPDATATCTTTLEFPSTLRQASAIALTGPSLEAKRGVLLGGAAIDTDSTWQPKPPLPLTPTDRTLKITVPPASALMVTTTP